MPTIVTSGIVVHAVNFREHDRMLTILTPERGCMDVLSRGCKRPKSPLMPCSDLFVCGEFTIFQNKESGILTGCDLEDNFYPLRLNPEHLLYASYIASLCKACAIPGEEAVGVYALLLKSLYYFSYDSAINGKATLTAFLLLLADEIGYRPRLKNCVHCRKPVPLEGDFWLDAEAGGLCCPGCLTPASLHLPHEAVVRMSHILRESELRQVEKLPEELFRAMRIYIEGRVEIPLKIRELLP